MQHTLTIDSVTMGAPLQAASTLAAPESWFLNFATGNPNGEPGPAVNEFTAYNYLAVWQCVSLIAGKIAELPLKTYRGDDDGRGRVEAKDRSEYRLLLDEFNPQMSAMTARETGLAHLLTWGNSYTQIISNKSGSTVTALVPTGPDVTKPRRENGAIVYDIFRRGTGEKIDTVPAEEMLHVPGLGFDGLLGYSPVRVAKSAIRAGMAQDQGAERFITRGIRPPGAIKMKEGKKFKDAQAAIQFRENFRAIHASNDSDLNVVVLEDGAEWQSLGVDPKSAQLLDSRKYSRKEICGLYRVPPFLLGDIESSTSWGTGVGQQLQAFVDYCLMTWIRRVEVEYKRKLAKDDPNIYYRHCVEDMLRGDFAGRTTSLQILHQRGIITDNDWRWIEHMNPVEGGDVRHMPLNEILIDAAGDPVSLATAPAPVSVPDPANLPPEPAARLAVKLRTAVLGAVSRSLRREAAEARKAATKSSRWVAWVDEYYARQSSTVADSVGPLVAAWAAAFGGLDDYPARHVARSREELLSAADGEASGFADRVARTLTRWESDRLSEVASEFSYVAPDPAPQETIR